MAIYKPAGLLVHRSDIDRHETQFAVQLVRNQIGRKVYPVHRLDKPTAGVLLFALNPESAKNINLQFSAHTVYKEYQAVVRGHTPDDGIVDHPIVRLPDKYTDGPISTEAKPQQAVTRFETLNTTELPHAVGRYSTARYSLVKLVPETGRKHQLRRHMKHISHHIIGDTSYGDGRHNRFFRVQFDCRRLLLCATRLVVKHPESQQEISLYTDVDALFSELLSRAGLSQGDG